MALKIGTLLPSLHDTSEWINGSVNDDSLAGHPILIQFWAVSCPACKVNMPRLQQIERDYASQGLRVISVHAPRGESDKDADAVRACMQQLGLNGPCAIDNEHIILNRFETNGFWPNYFFFDADHRLRSRAAGGMGLKIAENSLRRILQLDEPATSNPEPAEMAGAR